MQEREEVGEGRGGQATLKSCSGVKQGMERARPPSTAQSYQRSLVFLLWHQIKSVSNPQSSRLLSCALSPAARCPSLRRLSELGSPGLCLHSRQPVASPRYLKTRKLLELLSPRRRRVFAIYTQPAAEGGSCCQTAQPSSGCSFLASHPGVWAVRAGDFPAAWTRLKVLLCAQKCC